MDVHIFAKRHSDILRSQDNSNYYFLTISCILYLIVNLKSEHSFYCVYSLPFPLHVAPKLHEISYIYHNISSEYMVCTLSRVNRK